MSKAATPDHPVHELLSGRWSPYAFDAGKSVSREDLLSLFEAARWAASSYNEQPWRFMVATKENSDEFEKLLSCLVEPNQKWARQAPVLALGIAGSAFARNGKPNRCAQHDLGLAVGNLSAEATARGISLHQMAGILPDKARELFNVPDEYEIVTGLAIGYAADPESLPAELKQRETAPRSRKPLNELLFEGNWGEATTVLK